MEKLTALKDHFSALFFFLQRFIDTQIWKLVSFIKSDSLVGHLQLATPQVLLLRMKGCINVHLPSPLCFQLMHVFTKLTLPGGTGLCLAICEVTFPSTCARRCRSTILTWRTLTWAYLTKNRKLDIYIPKAASSPQKEYINYKLTHMVHI